MKKLLIGAFALMLATAFTACNQKNQSAANEEIVPDTATMKLVEKEKPIVNPMAEAVKKAQKEGEQWDVTQWKQAFKEMLTLAKPTMLAIQEMTKKIDENPDNDSIKAMINAEFSEMIYQFEDANIHMDDFRKAANATPSGKAALSDKEWIKEVMKELGLPESI